MSELIPGTPEWLNKIKEVASSKLSGEIQKKILSAIERRDAEILEASQTYVNNQKWLDIRMRQIDSVFRTEVSAYESMLAEFLENNKI